MCTHGYKESVNQKFKILPAVDKKCRPAKKIMFLEPSHHGLAIEIGYRNPIVYNTNISTKKLQWH